MSQLLKKGFIFFLASAFLMACSGGKKEGATSPTQEVAGTLTLTPEQGKQLKIMTAHAVLKEAGGALKVHGLIDVPPQNRVSISVPLGGYLKETHLLPGMHIRKGETIALMEDPQYIEVQQEYLSVSARFTYAEQEFARQRELHDKQAVSDKVFQQVTADYTSLKVERKALAEKLRLIGIDPQTLTEEKLSKSVGIPSPVDGYVTHVNANIGRYVRPEDVLFELVNPTDLHLALTVFEKDVDELFVGQEVIAYTNNQPDKKYACEVILVGKDFNEDHSVEVHCHFEESDPNLIPGLYMNAEIQLKKKSAWMLPTESVVVHEGISYVWLEKGSGGFELKEVLTGSSREGEVEVVFSDWAPDSTHRFVTAGAYGLLMARMNKAE